MPGSHVRIFGWTLVAGLFLPAFVRAASSAPPQAPDILAGIKLEPGKSAKITDPQTGGNGYWLVYLPKDYNPNRLWPIIYCYHGHNGEPTVYPFEQLTDGKGFIIIGMEYLDREAGGRPDPDLPNLQRIHDLLARHVALYEQVQFIGGFSQGGWSTSKLAEPNPDHWAGLIILGAGRGSSMRDPQVKSKPIFIGIGEMDPSNAAAKTATDYYKQHDADVTFEEFKGLAHAVDTNDAPLKQWLTTIAAKTAGAVVKMKTGMAAAGAAEKKGHLGEALTLYQSVARDGGDDAASAKAKADEISATADKAFASVEQALTEKRWTDAMRLLASGDATYAGSPIGDKFKARLESVRADPAIKSQIAAARADADAQATESAAQSAEKLGDYKRAIAIYERYVADFSTQPHLPEIRDHLAALKADKTIQAAIASKGADDQCKSWLSMADNYIQSGYPDKARPLLQKIVDEYPDTTYAKTAKKELAELK